MAATQSTDLAGTVYAKVIEMLVIEYQYDDVTCVPYFRYKSIAGVPTATAGFPRKVKNSVGTVATETTTISTTTMTTTNVDLTVGRVGIAREITETAQEDSTVAQSLSVQGLVSDASRLFGESFDTDATALFGSVTASVGSSGVALTVTTLVQLLGSQRSNKARGAQVIHLHDFGIKQLQVAQANTTATTWDKFYQPNADSTQYGGVFMNAPIWSSSKNPTANGAVDRVGACWSQGQERPEFCAFGFLVKRLPSSKEQPNVLMDSNIWASFCRYAVGILANNFATKVIHQNA